MLMSLPFETLTLCVYARVHACVHICTWVCICVCTYLAHICSHILYHMSPYFTDIIVYKTKETPLDSLNMEFLQFARLTGQ